VTKRTKIPKAVRDKVLVDAMHRCCLCPEHHEIIDLHHIEQISEGGPNTEDNLMAICPTCHAKIHRIRNRYTPEQLRMYKERWVQLCAQGLPLDVRIAQAFDTNRPPAPTQTPAKALAPHSSSSSTGGVPTDTFNQVRQTLLDRGPFRDDRPAHIFICYKRKMDPDQELARYLHKSLTAQGHDVFIDATLRTGEAWLDEIDRQIKSSDFLIVLLSKESANSEMVQAEIRRAYDYRKLQGRPHTLPVRIAYEGLLPYSIDAFLDPLQYVIWQSEVDNKRLVREVLTAIEGQLPRQEPIQLRPASGKLTLSEDGHVITDESVLHRPLPEFDPRFLEELEAPGGTVNLHDKFYVERTDDARLKDEIVKPGKTITIRAARQTGKSSLLVRGIHHVQQDPKSDIQIVHLDMQRVDRSHLESPDVFLRYLAEFIVRKLRLDTTQLDKLWQGSLGSQDKLTYLMEDYVLSECDSCIILAIDEADRLLQTDWHDSFFGLLRSWHNSRTLDDQLNKLNIVMVISTEPYLLIADVKQSPFNVGLRLYLKDFNETQVRDLNQRHGSPVQENDSHQLSNLLGGHPYLTRQALYTLVTENKSWTDLTRVAATDHGPFGDHLRRYHWLLRDEPDLRKALKEVIRDERCVDELLFFRLLRAGLVKGSGDNCMCRCDLYRMYFESKL
jgi:hypothetical protein